MDRSKRLPSAFFARPTLRVARDLLGVQLNRRLNGQILSGAIVECEAYIGEADTACHASHGRTPRTEVMYGPAGHAYIYFTYGMHWLLNIVTEEADFPAAVLIRAIEPLAGIEQMEAQRRRNGKNLTNGPARLCQALAIDGRLLGTDVTAQGSDLWLSEGLSAADSDIACGPRVGITYASPQDKAAPWRFWVKGNAHVSKK
jgi:DNA-3-methyladenine glycosylase